MKSIVIFASGSGSNAENIIRYFTDSRVARVVALFCNNPKAGAIERAQKLEIPVELISRESLNNGDTLPRLQPYQPDLIVLAGFLLKFPADIIDAFPNRIVNIHPALLPAYGGQGMYGMHVHKAVLENREPLSGISIHMVDAFYDEGDIVFQASTEVSECNSPEEIAARVQELEYEHYPRVIRQLLLNQ